MSLEAAIAELNANMKTLINVLTTNPQAALAQPVQPVKQKTEPEKTEPAKPAPAAAPAETAKPALDYAKDVQPKVLAVSAKKGRDAATALLGKFGLKTARNAKPEQWQDIINACEEALK